MASTVVLHGESSTCLHGVPGGATAGHRCVGGAARSGEHAVWERKVLLQHLQDHRSGLLHASLAPAAHRALPDGQGQPGCVRSPILWPGAEARVVRCCPLTCVPGWRDSSRVAVSQCQLGLHLQGRPVLILCMPACEHAAGWKMVCKTSCGHCVWCLWCCTLTCRHAVGGPPTCFVGLFAQDAVCGYLHRTSLQGIACVVVCTGSLVWLLVGVWLFAQAHDMLCGYHLHRISCLADCLLHTVCMMS